MTRNDLAKRLKQRPFAPFRLIVSEGANYEIRHPEQVILARDSVTIGVPSESEEFYETTVLVDLLHVIRLEPILAQAAKA